MRSHFGNRKFPEKKFEARSANIPVSGYGVPRNIPKFTPPPKPDDLSEEVKEWLDMVSAQEQSLKKL